MDRKLRMGMVGGGRGAFIGGVHRMAAALDGKIELVAGCFSADPEKSKLSGADLFLDPSRVYGTYQELIEKEAALPEGERVDFVSVVTRNDTHAKIATALLEGGFHVICDKPVAFSLEQALALREIVRKTGKIFVLTHNYTGYPMVKEAREWFRQGKLGEIMKVVVEFPQGYAITAMYDQADGAISNWRMDPSVAGVSNCMADIGTHSENLVRYITGLEIDEMCADLFAYIPDRKLDDDGMCLIRYKGGARGIIYASQVSNGDENNLTVRIYGTICSLEWHQEDPNELIIKQVDKPVQVLRRGNVYLTEVAQEYSRTPFAHPEGFIEAFANVYVAAAKAMADVIDGKPAEEDYGYPTIEDGVIGMAFIETCVASSKSDEKWVKFPDLS